jgi:predicted phosphodiesterase
MALRRFGAIGDVHAEAGALETAIAHLDALGVDAILCVGDIVDGQGDVDRCVALLRERQALVVRGNHERWFLAGIMRGLPAASRAGDLAPESVAWLADLPATLELETSAGSLLLCHGIGDDDMGRLLPEDEGWIVNDHDALRAVLDRRFELMVCGHTHRRMVRSFMGLTVINAGTLARDDAPGFVHVDVDRRLARTFDLDGDQVHAREEIVYGAPGGEVWGAGW